jgi:protein-disulfide isomerase
MIQKLFSIGRQAGMTDAEMNACLQDRAKAEAMVATYQKHSEADGVDATPLFIINGVKVDNMPYEELAKKLDAALGA